MGGEAAIGFVVVMSGLYGSIALVAYLFQRRNRQVERNHKETSLDHALHCLESGRGYLIVNQTHFFGHFWYIETTENLSERKAEKLMRQNVGFLIRREDFTETQKAFREPRYKGRVIVLESASTD